MGRLGEARAHYRIKRSPTYWGSRKCGPHVVGRHRRFHVLAPAVAIADAASKGRANVDQRQELIAAAEAGDTAAAFLALTRSPAISAGSRSGWSGPPRQPRSTSSGLRSPAYQGSSLRYGPSSAGVVDTRRRETRRGNAAPFVLTLSSLKRLNATHPETIAGPTPQLPLAKSANPTAHPHRRPREWASDCGPPSSSETMAHGTREWIHDH